ncbi:hypothetical protein [Legionella sp. WA2022007384]
MGKVSKTAEMRSKIIEKLTAEFKKLVAENGQAKAPLVALMNAGDNPQAMLITIDKKPVTLKFLGGSVISLFSATYKDFSVVFRVLPAEEKYVAAYDVLRVQPELAKHFPERYLLLPFKNRKNSYYLELIEYCGKGSLERHAEDFDTSFDYSRKMLQLMVDLERAGFRFTDIKPSNFIVADDGRLVLCDIKSLLNVLEESSIPKMEVAQTPIYRSRPTSLSVTSSSDTSSEYSISEIDYKSRYKMGVSIYEVITGVPVASNFGNSKKSLFNLMNQQQYDLAKDTPLGLDAQTIQLAVTNLSAYLDQLDMQGPGTRLDFNHPAFNSPLGKSVKKVIRGLTHEKANKRMDFSQALLMLTLAAKKEAISSTAIHNAEQSSAPQSDESMESTPEKKKHKAKKKVSIKMFSEQELATSSASYLVEQELQQTTPEPEKKPTPKLSLNAKQYSHRDLEKHLMFKDKTPKTARGKEPREQEKAENVTDKRNNFKGKGRAASVSVIPSISKTIKPLESDKHNSGKTGNLSPKYY